MVKEKKDDSKFFGHPMFYEIVDELKTLHSVKNKQYATKDNHFGNFYRTGQLGMKLFNPVIENKALASAMGFMLKQIDGVYEMVGENKKDTVEELEDKFKDIAVYSIICMILIREGKKW